MIEIRNFYAHKRSNINKNFKQHLHLKSNNDTYLFSQIFHVIKNKFFV